MDKVVYGMPGQCPECGSDDIGMDHLSYIPGKGLKEVCDDFSCGACGVHWANFFTYEKTVIHKEV